MKTFGRLGIGQPIVRAAMAGVWGLALAAAMSEAGWLVSIEVGGDRR